jgi:hypothetical protein
MYKSVLLILIMGLTVGCKPKIKAPALRSNLATLDRVVYLGDSYLSGYQDAALSEDGQLHSVAALLSRSFENVGGGSIVQPLLNYGFGVGINSKPWNGELNTQSVLNNNIADCTGELGLKPVKVEFAYDGGASYVNYSGSKTAITDFSMPFASTDEYFLPSTGDEFSSGGNLYYHRIAQTTILEDAKNANPTFSVIWAGMEDVFRYCRNGGKGVLLSVTQFEANLDSVLMTLIGASEQGVIANIPEFTTFPYYTLIPFDGADLTQGKADTLNGIYHLGGGNPNINFVEGNNGFVTDDDNTFKKDQLAEGEYITLSVPLDSMKCFFLGSVFGIPDEYVLDSAEVLQIEQVINGYNTVIIIL